MAEPAPTETPEAVKEVKLRIQLPSCIESPIEFVETHHTLQETISDVKEALAATSVLNSLTNYSLIHGDVRITEEFDDFATLVEVLGDISGDVALHLVERAYTLKSVHEHLLRFRENIGLNFFDAAARLVGVAAGGSKLSALGLKDIELDNTEAEKESTKDSVAKEPVEPAETEKYVVTDDDKAEIKATVGALLDSSTPDLTKHAFAETVLSKWKLPLKALLLAQWNPVPQQQRLKGDLLYLTLTTLESETFSITCHASGFFVSRLSNAHFNPAVKVNEKGVTHRQYVFYNLVSQLSPLFAQTIAANKEALSAASQFSELYLIPSQSPASYPWLVSESQVAAQTAPDASRVQVPLLANGVDGAELVKDWNDEFQGIKEFPRDSFNERLLRDKLLNKYIQEFNSVAVSTAVAIVNGNLVPLNPNEPRDKHIYLRNNIFYSFGVNATGAHDDTGGDEAARYCFGKDLATVKLLNRVDAPGVCNLLSCIVDYLGERVVCQAPVPGVFSDQSDDEGNPIDKVAYGLSLEVNEIKTNDKFDEVLKPVADAFHLKPHAVELASGATSESQLLVSKDTKGIFGTDGRKYLIDLYRTTPLDVDFLDTHFDGSATSYPHKEASLRHEAVEEWYKRKAAAIFKVETERLEKEGKLDGQEKPQVAIPYDQLNINPDAFTGVNESAEDQRDVRDLSEFVAKHLVPEFLDDISKNVAPFDGAQLTDYLHKTGINMRYLGAVATAAAARVSANTAEVEQTIKDNEVEIAKRAEEKQRAEKDEKDNKDEKKDEDKEKDEKKEPEPSAAKLIPVVANLTALQQLAVQEMIARAVKHVLRSQGQAVPVILKPHFVVHVHNCLLGQAVNSAPVVSIDDITKSLVHKADLEFTNLTPAQVVALVEQEVLVRFRYTLPSGWVNAVKSLPLVREIAHKAGIQWKAQAYHFSAEEFAAAQASSISEPVVDTKKKGKKKHTAVVVEEVTKRDTVFVTDDLVNFVPLVKDSSFRCSFVDEIYETARVQINEGEKEVGLALLAELVSFYQQIYGNVHLETSNFYSTLAQIYAECNMTAEASIVSRRAAILYERLTGVDSYETINSYVKASFYDSLNKDHVSAFKLNTKAYENWSVVFGADHPNTINTLSSFGTIMQEMKISADAKRFFEKAIELSSRLNGAVSDITAIIRHRLAILLVQTNDFQGALEQFQAAGDIFAKVIGPDDALSKECANFSTNLTTYLVYNQQQLAEKKKQLAQQGKKAKAAVKPQAASAKSKKTKAAVSDPSIASKSVDEILLYIEGGQGKKSKKNKK